jgi:type II secretory pathway predicted ATPase ExeA
MKDYRSFFGFEKEAFPSDIALKDILMTDTLQGVLHRFSYALRLGGVALVTGEIGSGKSTALRYAAGQLHPSEYQVFHVTACTGSIMELYRQIVNAMTINRSSISKSIMVNLIKKEIKDLVLSQKMKPFMIIDEASLMRLEVFSEIHTLCQFDQDSKRYLPMILAGHSNLVDKLLYRTSAPLASRVIARTHLEGLDLAGMQEYIRHHIRLAGMDTNVFDDAAVTAIHQGSGGLLRKANHLARGALMAAAQQDSRLVTAEHVRISATELL